MQGLVLKLSKFGLQDTIVPAMPAKYSSGHAIVDGTIMRSLVAGLPSIPKVRNPNLKPEASQPQRPTRNLLEDIRRPENPQTLIPEPVTGACCSRSC